MPEIPMIVPQVPGPTRVNLGVEQGAGLRGLGNQIVSQAVDARERARRLDEAVSVASATAALSYDLGKQRLDLQQDPDYASHTQKFFDYAKQRQSELAASLPSDEARAVFQMRSAGLVESNGLDVTQTSEKIHLETLGAATMDARTKLVQAAVDARDPLTRQQNMDLLDETIAGDPLHVNDPLGQEKLRNELHQQIDEGRYLQAVRGIAEAPTARAAAGNAAIANSIVDASSWLDPAQRERAKLAIESQTRVTQDRMRTEQRQALEDASRDQYSEMAGRALSENLRSVPSFGEIGAARYLTGPQKLELASAVTRRLKGDLEVTDPQVAMDAYKGIVKGTVTNYQDQVLPLVIAGKMSMQEGEKARGLIDALAIGTKAQAREFDSFLMKMDGVIGAKNPLGVFLAPDAPKRQWDFRYLAAQRWQEELAAGRDPTRTLLDPNSPTSLEKDAQRLAPPTPQEMLRSFTQGAQNSPLPPASTPPTMPAGLPPGSRYLGRDSKGLDVWQAVDGTQWRMKAK